MRAGRDRPPTPWREWFFSLLLGVGLALLCIALLSRRETAVVQLQEPQASSRPSVGLEFHISFHILLPENKGG